MTSKLFHPATERTARPTTFNALLMRLGFGAFAAPDRKLSAVLASSGGKFTDSLERDLESRPRDLW
jgi:hypothetical protein